ncbi:MAG: RDD family protein [Thermodesulfobacteriota bacterium]|nr:RDD family protein [Thermodesulfobacteriota bacterium]
MEWFYATTKDPIGPISEEEFQNLVKQGKITPGTLVWNSTMTDWKHYSDVFGSSAEKTAGTTPPTDASGGTPCSECGRIFSRDEMIRFGESWVCAACKPVFVQKLKEGVNVAGDWVYGGFWVRFGAKIIDGIIIGVIQGILNFGVGMVAGISSTPTNPEGMTAFFVVFYIVNIGVAVAYTTWFLGKYAATPGKMALGLKVITADGGKVSYLKAFGRYFAEIVSGIILCIGYIMAAFDDEKRTLHDRICNTRVVKK